MSTFDHDLYLKTIEVAKKQSERRATLYEQTAPSFKRYCEFFHNWYKKWCDDVRAKTGKTYSYTTVPEGLLNLVSYHWSLASAEDILGWVENFNPAFVYYKSRDHDPDEDPTFIEVPVSFFMEPDKWLEAKGEDFRQKLSAHLADYDDKIIAENAKAEAKRVERERAEWERLNAIFGPKEES